MGLDVRTWLAEELVDILVIGGGYYYSKAATDWTQLTRDANVPLYICRYRSRGLEQDRAFVTWYRFCGADGIYCFNFNMPNDVSTIHEVGDPLRIASKDKHYVMSGSMVYGRGHVSVPGIIP